MGCNGELVFDGMGIIMEYFIPLQMFSECLSATRWKGGSKDTPASRWVSHAPFRSKKSPI